MGEPRWENDVRPSVVAGMTPALLDAGALVRQLSARILESASATGAILAWCEEHDLSSGPISAIRHPHDPIAAIDDEALDKLRPAGKPFCYRRVRLVRGDVALAEADNWFMPHRLLPGMRDILKSTDVPFGIAIEALKPSRRTFRVRLSPVKSNHKDEETPEAQGVGLRLPEIVLEHDAVIVDGDGNPLAVVKERFRSELLMFAYLPHRASIRLRYPLPAPSSVSW